MKKNSLLAICAIVTMGAIVTSCNNGSVSTNVGLSKPVDSVSYAIGVNFGSGLRSQLSTLPRGESNIDAIIAGFVTAIKGDSSHLKITALEAPNKINDYLMRETQKEAEVTKAEGDAFLESNKSKEGVITTESGLQYKVLTEGTGPKPTATDKVKVRYKGQLLDGTVFDQSGEEPIELSLGGVIAGWTEALQIMPVGSKYQVWIPSQLAYGESGAGQQIKPNSALEFEIELVEIVK
jgi:FKBP-type peptidyl-prolyl cis-trans isomerase